MIRLTGAVKYEGKVRLGKGLLVLRESESPTESLVSSGKTWARTARESNSNRVRMHGAIAHTLGEEMGRGQSMVQSQCIAV